MATTRLSTVTELRHGYFNVITYHTAGDDSNAHFPEASTNLSMRFKGRFQPAGAHQNNITGMASKVKSALWFFRDHL